MGRSHRARHRGAIVLGVALVVCAVATGLPSRALAEQAADPTSSAEGRVDAGSAHSCALSAAGSLRCWGFSGDGQLGYGTTDTIGDDETPAAIGPVSFGAGRTTVAVSTGDFHTCALLDDGSVRCWGFGAQGRLGYANDNSVTSPGSVGPVDLGGAAKAITAGGAHTCAVLVNGSVRCWGFGGTGQLGYGNLFNIGDDETPASAGSVKLGPRRTAVAISAGARHTCAVLDNGSVRCWGEGAAGQLGYGNKNRIGNDETPDRGRALGVACPSVSQCTAVDDSGGQVTFNPTTPGSPDTTTIDGGHALFAVACPSTVQCTAVDDSGRQVTFNPTAPGTPDATTIDSGKILRAVACPSTTQCTAVDASGRQVTFNPTTPGTPTPTMINSGAALLGVACPSTGQCTAVDNAGRQVTFNPTAPSTPTPTTIDVHALTAVACLSPSQCTAVNDSAGQVTFNPTAPGTPTSTTIDIGNLIAVACPSTTQCTAVGGAGREVTFNPTAPGTPTSSTIDSDRTLRGVACPSISQCTAVDNIGRETTFNPAAPGSLVPIPIDTAAPVSLGLGRTAKAISGGLNHTCAVLDDGTVRCWGDGGNGQLGYANTDSIGNTPATTPDTAGPVSLGAGRTAKAISAGDAHTCAVLNDGSVRCWGLGASGRLGYANQDNIGDNETPASAGPVNLGAGRTAVALSAGGRHTCARLDDASVRCWGFGANGRLGYCSNNSIGDDETPDAAGSVNIAPGDGGTSCGAPGGSSTGAVQSAGVTKAPVASSDAVRARALRRCLAAVAAHASREKRLIRRGSARRRARARRHLSRHARDGRRRCLRLYGRTPGRVTGLRARAIGKTQVELSFNAPGTDGSHAPPAGSYVIKQSLRRIRGARDFSRARALCKKGVCRFTVSRVGGKVSLAVTDLRPHTTYYYALVARDNVSARRGPRSQTVKARTR